MNWRLTVNGSLSSHFQSDSTFLIRGRVQISEAGSGTENKEDFTRTKTIAHWDGNETKTKKKHI